MTDEELQKLLDEATPGPWSVGAQNDTLFIIDGPPNHWDGPIPKDFGPEPLAKVYSIAEEDANACLIAAAPTIARELLEARATIREMALQALSDDALVEEIERLREALKDTASRAHAALSRD